MAAITIAIGGELQILLFLQNRAELVIATMPVRSKAISRLLWYCSVVHLPIVYGIVQALLRFVFALGAGDFSGIQVVLPTVLLAMGIGSVLHLCRPVTSRFFFSGAHPLRDLNVVSLIVILAFSGTGWTYYSHDPSRGHLVVPTIVAAVLTGVSYRNATAPGLIGRRYWQWRASPGVKDSASIRRRRPTGASAFHRLWLDGFAVWSAYVFVVFASWLILLPKIPDGESNVEGLEYLLTPLTMVPLLVFPQRFTRLDYRIIRTLPLRRWQQTALALSLALPVLLPISVAIIGVSLYVALPVANILVFLLAYGGCCVFAVSFSATVLGNQGPICAGLLGLFATSIPLGIAEPAPAVVATVGVFGALLWPISIVNFYWELRGNGWLYTKRFDTEPMVRENV